MSGSLRQRLASVIVPCLVCLAWQTGYAQEREFERAWQEFGEGFVRNLEEQHVVGASVAVAKDGRTVGSRYYGFADAATSRIVNADTLFHWASMTKLFTAIAVMQLRDRGLLSLDDPIVNYLPETNQIHDEFGATSAITLRHLLTHSSGLRGPTFPWRGTRDWEPYEPASWSQVAAMMPYTVVEFAPGSKFSYSNLGFSMLGRVVEEISGDPIEMYITKNILMPLGMTRSFFDRTPYFLLPYRSNNYEVTTAGSKAFGLDLDTGATNGNGGLNGSVADMMLFANFLLGVNVNDRYDTVLSRSTLQEMWQPRFDAADATPVDQKMGLAFFLIDRPVGTSGRILRFIGHTGSQLGFTSFVYVQLESRTAAVTAINTRNEEVARPDSVLIRTRTDLLDSLVPGMAR